MHNENNGQSVDHSESLIYFMFLFAVKLLLTECISCRFCLTVTQMDKFLVKSSGISSEKAKMLIFQLKIKIQL